MVRPEILACLGNSENRCPVWVWDTDRKLELWPRSRVTEHAGNVAATAGARDLCRRDGPVTSATVAATFAPSIGGFSCRLMSHCVASRNHGISRQISEKFGKTLKRMAGTTGLEPATSDVTDLRSGPIKSWTYLCFSSLRAPRSDTECHKMPQNDTFSAHLLHTDFDT